jgi:hypothetical protein
MTDMPEPFFLHRKLDEIECYSDASSARKSTSVVFSRVMDALIVVYRDSPTHGPVHSTRPFEQPSILQGHAGSEAKRNIIENLLASLYSKKKPEISSG